MDLKVRNFIGKEVGCINWELNVKKIAFPFMLFILTIKFFIRKINKNFNITFSK